MAGARDSKPKQRSKGMGVALSNALAEFEMLFSPASEHRIEEQRRSEVMADQVGISLDEATGKVIVRGPVSSQEGH